MGWEEEGGGGGGEREKERCVFVEGGSQPRWHNKVRSTTLLLDPPNLSFPVALSLSSLLLVFSPSWTLNPAGGGVFSGISSRIPHCCSNYLSTPNPNCISFFHIHVSSLTSFALFAFPPLFLWWITSRSLSRSSEKNRHSYSARVTLRLVFVDA